MHPSATSHPHRSAPTRSPRRLGQALAAAVTAVALVGIAGCGVTSKKVATKSTTTLKPTTTTAATTTTTTSPDTSSDTSTDTSASTDTSSDTGAGKKWPASLRDQIITSCKSALTSGDSSGLGGPDTCECVVRALEKKYTFEQVIGMGTDSSGKAALTEASKQATIDCIADPTSH